jgi:hypothetical protein
MAGSAPFRLNRSGMLLALISAAFSGQAAAAAGRVDFVTPGVTVAGRDGQARPLARGTELDSGDTVRTSDAGRAQIRFTDGSYVSLQPNTDFSISDYKFEGKDDDRGFFGLVKGAMRTVTGAVGRVNRNSYRITTPTATVGIRGTGGVVQILPNGATLVIGTSGIWSLTNPAGSIDIPAGVSGLAPTEPNQPPKETNTQPQTGPAPVPPKNEFTQGDQVNPDGTAAIVSTFKPLVTGDGYTPVIGYDTSSFCDFLCVVGGHDGGEAGNPITTSAIFNERGEMTGLDLFGRQIRLGSGTHADFGSDGILAWGRWVGTIITDQLCEGSPCTQTFNENDGFHYVIGKPTAVMPTGGSANYALAGATRPTYTGNGAVGPGTFNGSLTVNFGATHGVTGNFNVAMPDKSYAWTSSTTTFGAAFNMSTTSGITGCSDGLCNAQVRGFFAGASAERVGLGYMLEDNNTNKTLFGAAAFKKQP